MGSQILCNDGTKNQTSLLPNQRLFKSKLTNCWKSLAINKKCKLVIETSMVLNVKNTGD